MSRDFSDGKASHPRAEEAFSMVSSARALQREQPGYIPESNGSPGWQESREHQAMPKLCLSNRLSAYFAEVFTS